MLVRWAKGLGWGVCRVQGAVPNEGRSQNSVISGLLGQSPPQVRIQGGLRGKGLGFKALSLKPRHLLELESFKFRESGAALEVGAFSRL